MKTVLVTTTIFVPEVLRKYRELGPDVRFVVVGDRKSPHREILDLLNNLGGYVYLTPEEQNERYPALSETIGWDSIQRRNIGFLEAAKLEPDLILSIDDDNIPQGDYFRELERVFQPHYGYVADGPWFNIGDLATDRFTYRGFPKDTDSVASFGMNGKAHEIGVVNGLIYGDPDIGALERIDRNPMVAAYSMEAQHGIALDPARTWSPINSQNTAWRAELAPLMFCLPRVGRADDIWGSYIAQTVLAGTGLHTFFGRPFVKQERNPQDVMRNLADERHLVAQTPRLTEYLRSLEVPEGTVLERLRYVLEALELSDVYLPFPFFAEWLAAWERL